MTQLAENISRINLTRQAELAAKAAKTKPQTQRSSLLALVNHPRLAAAYFKAQHFMVTGTWQMSDAPASPPVRDLASSGPRPALVLPPDPEPPTQGPKKDPNVSKVKKALVVAGSSVVGGLAIGAVTTTAIILLPAAIVGIIDPAILIALGVGAGGALGGTAGALLPRLRNGVANQISKRMEAGYGNDFSALPKAQKDLATLMRMKETPTIRNLITRLSQTVENYERSLSLRFTVPCSFDGGTTADTEILIDIGNEHTGVIPRGILLGQGTYAEVYKARAIRPDGSETPVAVKIIKLGNSRDIDKRAIDEGHAMAAINHPNVVPIYGQGKTEMGRPILVMELMASTLKDEATNGRVDAEGEPVYQPTTNPKQVANQMIDVLSALQEMHDNGVYHRDLKPGNLFFSRLAAGLIKIGDFGMAKITSKALKQNTSQLTFSIAGAGAAVGTDNFIAPEYSLMSVFDKLETINPTTGKTIIVEKLSRQQRNVWQTKNDLFAIGVILYLTCTGKYPYEFGYKQYFANPENYARKIVETANNDAPVKPVINEILNRSQRVYEESVLAKRTSEGEDAEVFLRNGIPKPLFDIICKAIDYNPDNRFSSAAEMKLTLQAYVDGVGSSRAFGGVNLSGSRDKLTLTPPEVAQVERFFSGETAEILTVLNDWAELNIDTEDLPFQVSAATQNAFDDGVEDIRRTDRNNDELARQITTIRKFFSEEIK